MLPPTSCIGQSPCPWSRKIVTFIVLKLTLTLSDAVQKLYSLLSFWGEALPPKQRFSFGGHDQKIRGSVKLKQYRKSIENRRHDKGGMLMFDADMMLNFDLNIDSSCHYLCFSSGQKRSLSSQKTKRIAKDAYPYQSNFRCSHLHHPWIRWPLVVQVNN